MRDDIKGTRHLETCDGQAGRHRFQHGKSACVSPAWKYKYVRGGIAARQVLTSLLTQEKSIGMPTLEPCPRRPIADDNFGPGQLETKECADVFFNR